LLGGKTFTITASIGVTFFPHDDQTSDTLLRHADQAMYIAKRLGKNCYYIFNSDEDVLQKTQTEQRKRIKNALLDQQFELFYQPKVTLADRHIVGAEALIRWNNPERGLLSPHEFLPYIENTELDIQLGEWVIVHALKQIDDWNQQGLILEISINISAYHLQTTTFIPYLKQQLKNYPSIAAHQLQIEILETAALSDIFKVSSIMNACEELGVNFALDDFGMGYSSLAYLRRLPAKTLKIDQSFVRDMLSDQEDRAIIKGVIALSKTFNRTTVAEGVESEAHFEMLREMGCDIAQGYGIARPMPAREIKSWCENF
jgi:EAL domain-containing protein (putative c-di-GMP-specific phosphodiesterase class I)